LFSAGHACDADVDDSDTLNKKIRNAQLAQYNFILGAERLDIAQDTQFIYSKSCILFLYIDTASMSFLHQQSVTTYLPHLAA